MLTQRIFFVGVGGQGNVLTAKLLGAAAILADIPVSISETHGMAQRGGVVESSVVIGGQSPIISNHEADVIVAFEPLEALRSLKKANSKTIVITSLSRIPPFTVAIGGGDYPSEKTTLKLLKEKVQQVYSFDALSTAKDIGNRLGVNMVMLGALIGAGVISIPEDSVREAIRTKTKQAFVQLNLECFECGMRIVKNIVAEN